MEPVVTALQARRRINFARCNHQAPSILAAPLVQKRPHFCEQRQCTFERSNADLPFDFGDVVGDRLDRSLPRLAASSGHRDPSAAAIRRIGRALCRSGKGHAWRRSEHGDQQTDPTPPLHAPRYTGRHALEWVVAFPRMRNDKRRPRTCNQAVMSGPACSKVSENTDVFRDEA
jgi:hypothetical protein